MTSSFDREFDRHYTGRHAPEDALFWLDHPDQTGPTGAEPVQVLFLRVEERLRSDGQAAAADRLLVALAELLSADRRAALDAARDAALAVGPGSTERRD